MPWMPWEAWFTLAIVAVLVLGLIRSWAPTDILALGCLTLIILVSDLSGSKLLPGPREAVLNFGNPGLITVAVLFIVVTGLVQTGAMTLLTQPLIGRPQTVLQAQSRLLFPVTILSAFLNNTPVVAMFMPVVDDICKKTGISPSKLFLPLAYAATFGGICTLIGTSTNLVVNGLVIASGLPQLNLFSPAWVGVPGSLICIIYILVCSRWLLPDRRPAISLTDDPRQYTVEMIVQPGGPLAGRSVEEAGLRHLPGLYLVEIERDGEILPAVSPTERLRPDDRLVFVGIVESVVDLRKMRGLIPATNQVFKLTAPATQRCMIEAVVSDRCPIVGKTIREGNFRTRYNAAVIAVARSGRRLPGKIGDIVLRAGDTLLLEAHAQFVREQRNSNDFFLVSRVENSAPPRHEKAWLALLILIGLVAAATIGWLDILTAGMLAAGLMVITRCCTSREARQSIDWSVLTVIGAALGIGMAIETSGAADTIAAGLIGLAGGHPWLVLAAVYFVTTLFTELITNNAAAVLVFPIAVSAAESLEPVASPLPFIMAVMIGASAGFATPFGYQTNLMVYGPGGYKFSDYIRVGVPMNIIFMIVTLIVAPFVWPFYS